MCQLSKQQLLLLPQQLIVLFILVHPARKHHKTLILELLKVLRVTVCTSA